VGVDEVGWFWLLAGTVSGTDGSALYPLGSATPADTRRERSGASRLSYAAPYVESVGHGASRPDFAHPTSTVPAPRAWRGSGGAVSGLDQDRPRHSPPSTSPISDCGPPQRGGLVGARVCENPVIDQSID